MNIDQINYVKPLKRYSLAHMLLSVLALAFAAIAVLMVIKPWYALSIPAYDTLEAQEIVLTGKDVVMNALGLIKKESDPITAFINYLAGLEGGAAWLKYVALATQYMLPAGLVFFALSSLVLALMGLIGLFKGYSNKHKAIKKWAGFGLFGFLLMFITIAIYTFLLPIFAGKANITITPNIGNNYIYVGVLVGACILINIFYNTVKGKTYVGNLKKASVSKDEAVSEVVANKETKVEDLAKKLDDLAKKSEKLELIDLTIPEDTVELAANEYANRDDIKTVNLPLGIKSIGENCFANCTNLTAVIYPGTKEEFKLIKKEAGWLENCGSKIVVCQDGKLSIASKK